MLKVAAIGLVSALLAMPVETGEGRVQQLYRFGSGDFDFCFYAEQTGYHYEDNQPDSKLYFPLILRMWGSW